MVLLVNRYGDSDNNIANPVNFNRRQNLWQPKPKTELPLKEKAKTVRTTGTTSDPDPM